jgi:hypothetical protein
MGRIDDNRDRQLFGSGTGYRSTQSILLPDVDQAFDAWGTRSGLLALLRRYFAIAERSVGRLVRARWHGGQPALVLLWPPIPFVRMGEPALDLTADRRAIRVGIEGGLLVMPLIQAYLAIELSRGTSEVLARVDLVGYWPRFGQFAIVRRLYELTQSRVHQSVGLRYLRLLRDIWLHPMI